MKAHRLLFVCMPALLLSAAGDPFVGTWKLDAYRSKFAIGEPRFMFATMKIESSGTGLKSTASAADGEGVASDFTFNCSLDGTPCNIVAAIPMRGVSAVDAISLKRVDDHTIAATGFRNRKIVYEDQRVVSADGKTMSVTRKGMTPEGKKYESTLLLERIR